MTTTQSPVDELFRIGAQRTFRGRQLAEIAFPLGGIGTGTVSLGGRGNLCDWEIFNRPNKGYAPPWAFFAIRACRDGGEPILRILEAP
ncbi:MAG TPA: GH116 family glycosyl-hydrolase, partial [Armatimonadota bacterium]|nr:GH116 family glycosyl-hydrolase [Armatimonadota bacterium]